MPDSHRDQNAANKLFKTHLGNSLSGINSGQMQPHRNEGIPFTGNPSYRPGVEQYPTALNTQPNQMQGVMTPPAFPQVPQHVLDMHQKGYASLPYIPHTPPIITTTGTGTVQQQKKNLRTVLLVALILVVVLSVGGLYLSYKAFAPTNITAYHVSTKSVSMDVGGGGIIYPNQLLNISYPFTVHVVSVLVKPGDVVTANQSLVQLDLTQTNAHNIEILNAEITRAANDVSTAQDYLSSVTNSTAGVNDPVLVAGAQLDYNKAVNRYNQLVAEAGAPSLHQGTLVSAMKGVVTAVSIVPGDIVSANKVMLTVADEANVVVHAKISLSDFGKVHLNQAALLTPSALVDSTFKGTVISIIPTSDAQTDTFEVWIVMANPNGAVLPGMNVFVRIQNPITSVVVPRLAVLNPDREAIVFVVDGQLVHLRHVQITGYAGDYVIIKSGLSDKDTIVLAGLDTLHDGQSVKITADRS